MLPYLQQYLQHQKAALDSIPTDAVHALIQKFTEAWRQNRQIFVFGNGGSGSNASHFINDLGKSASDSLSHRFRCLSLNEHIGWITALGNDYAFEDIFVRQLENYAQPGDLVMVMSVSGNSPNLVKAIAWANGQGLETVALVGGKKGQLADLARFSIVIDSEHYGRVEDAHMAILHMICYAFIEHPEIVTKEALPVN